MMIAIVILIIVIASICARLQLVGSNAAVRYAKGFKHGSVLGKALCCRLSLRCICFVLSFQFVSHATHLGNWSHIHSHS